MRLDLRTKLTLLNWEEAVRSGRSWTQSGWAENCRQEGITVDLSRVERVEPTAALRTVLLVERALLDGLTVTVRMPRRTPTAREGAIQTEAVTGGEQGTRQKAGWIGGAIGRRRKAAMYLDQLEFREALEHQHLKEAPGRLDIIDNYDWSRDEASSSQKPGPSDEDLPPEPEEQELLYTHQLYPLRWVGSLDEKDGQAHMRRLSEADVLAGILTAGSKRLAYADGKTLSDVFMKELVENAIRHGEMQYALITAWSRPAGIHYNPADVLECERPFLAWCEYEKKDGRKGSVPLVEICVGDSGRGIPRTLGKTFAKEKREMHFPLQKADPDDEILAWSFDKWSTSKPEKSSRGTRGLYRVARIVRKYDGLITLRSERSLVGYDCGSASSPAYILQGKGMHKLGRCPGTVAHVRLPVTLAERIPARSTPGTPLPCSLERVDLSNITWLSPEDALKEVRRRIMSAWGHTKDVIVADLGYAQLDGDMLYSLLLELTELAHPVGIVVVNLREPHWDVCRGVIEALSESELKPKGDRKPSPALTAEDPDSLHIRDPILLRHVDGHLAWVGVPRNLLKTIYNPLLEKGSLSFADLGEVEKDQERRNHLIRLLRERYHLLSVSDSAVHLKITREGIERQVPLLTRERLKRAFEDSARLKALPNTVFLTPTLRYVRSFVNVGDLLEPLWLDRATGALATLCIDVLKEKCRERPVEVIAESRIAADLVERFRQHLADLLPGAKEVKLTQIGPAEDLSLADDGVVVVFSDIIFTTSTLRRLISQTVRAKGEIVLIAVIFDTRTDKRPEDWFSGRPVPHVSLCDVDIWSSDQPPDGHQVCAIAPETFHEEKPAPAAPHYLVSREDVVAMAVQQQAIYFDHIVRPNGRHFCQYLDPLALLVGHPHSRKPSPDKLCAVGRDLVRYYQDVAADWLQSLGGQGARLLVGYPDNEKPSAAWLIASELATKLGGDLSSISHVGPPLHPPATSLLEDPKPYSTAIVADWGALSGKHIRDCIRMVAKAGVRQILVIIFLSQMPEDEERFLREIQSVSSGADAKGPAARVTVRFLARFPIAAYDGPSCPHCMQVARITEEERHYSFGMLRQYARDVRERLRKVGVLEAAKRAASLPPVAPEDILALSAVRELIVRAKSRTDARLELMRELRSLDAPEGTKELAVGGRRLMKLLASEWTLLKQEPLIMPQFKDQIAALARLVICDEDASESERIDAIVVLRTASKRRFAQHLAALFEAVYHSEPLVRQLLVCAFTFLQRDYQVQDSLALLVNALKGIDERIESLLRLDRNRHLAAAFETSGYVLHKAYSLVGHGKATPMRAWADLRVKLTMRYNQHTTPIDAFKKLPTGDEKVSDKPRTQEDWNSLWTAWRKAAEPFLIDDVYHLIKPLGAVFTRMGNGSVFPSEQENRNLRELVAGEVYKKVAGLRFRLHQFALHPEQVHDDAHWQELVRARDWLWDVVVNPGYKNSDLKGASTLVKVVAGCPASFSECVKAIARRVKSSLTVNFEDARPTPADDQVFIHKDLLEECFSELLYNAWWHNDAPEGKEKTALIRAWTVGNRVQVSIRNNGTPNGNKGDQLGVASFRQRLAPFDADLVNGPIDENGWTYEVRLSFLKWVTTQ